MTRAQNGGERTGTSPITSNLSGDHETRELPETAVLASLGCGKSDDACRNKAGRDGRGSRRHFTALAEHYDLMIKLENESARVG